LGYDFWKGGFVKMKKILAFFKKDKIENIKNLGSPDSMMEEPIKKGLN